MEFTVFLVFKTVKISVYYESLCPDSVDFIRHQLLPLVWTDLATAIDVDLISYGKARVSVIKAKVFIKLFNLTVAFNFLINFFFTIKFYLSVL